MLIFSIFLFEILSSYNIFNISDINNNDINETYSFFENKSNIYFDKNLNHHSNLYINNFLTQHIKYINDLSTQPIKYINDFSSQLINYKNDLSTQHINHKNDFSSQPINYKNDFSSQPINYKSDSSTQHIEFINGYSPVISWETLTGYVINNKINSTIISHINEAAQLILPVLLSNFTELPNTSEQCQLACLLHSNCLSFIHFNDIDCYLTQTHYSKLNIINDFYTIGPKFSPEFDFDDWDNDSIQNIYDGCPLHKNKYDKFCLCLYTTPKDDACNWNVPLNSCVSLFKDLRKQNNNLIEIVGSGLNNSTKFINIKSPENCQFICQNKIGCTHYSFSFVFGCHLFSDNELDDTKNVFNSTHLGLPNELSFGFVTGPRDCPKEEKVNKKKKVNYNLIKSDCLRYETRFIGKLIWPAINLISATNCASLCSITRPCLGWTFTKDENNSNGFCDLFYVLLNEEVFTDSISAPRDKCGSCKIDTDGDLVFDCQDYCPKNKKKLFPGYCGCKSSETPPLCFKYKKYKKQRFLLENELSEICFDKGYLYVADDKITIPIRDQNPLYTWLNEQGLPDRSQTTAPLIPEDCQLMCQYSKTCVRWNFFFNKIYRCFLFSSVNSSTVPIKVESDIDTISGIAFCPGTCFDGLLNQDEEMIDCGGDSCSPCGTLCTDGRLNQNENDIDCGGVCPKCTCQQNNGGCQHFCISFENKSECFCKPGYTLDIIDKQSCLKSNTCDLSENPPCLPFPCTQNEKGFECSCPEKWYISEDGWDCIPPIQGPCFIEDMEIHGEILNEEVSTSTKRNVFSSFECQNLCKSTPTCFIWQYQKNSKNDSDCRLLSIGSGATTKKEGVTSGYKFGDPSHNSCNVDISYLDIVKISDARLSIIYPGDKSLVETASIFETMGNPFILRFKISKGNADSIFVRINTDADFSDFYDKFGHHLTINTRKSSNINNTPRKLLENNKNYIESKKYVNLDYSLINFVNNNDLFNKNLNHCTFSHNLKNDNDMGECILKGDRLITNTTVQLEIIPYAQKVSGDIYRTRNFNLSLIEPFKNSIEYSISRDAKNKKLKANFEWYIPLDIENKKKLKLLQHKLESINLIASKKPINHLINSKISISVGKEKKWKDVTDLPKVQSFINNKEPYLNLGLGGCKKNEEWRVDTIVGLTIEFQNALCIKSIEFGWHEMYNPQISSLQELQGSNWLKPKNLVQHKCIFDRFDNWILNSENNSENQTKAIRLLISHGCLIPKCDSFILKYVKILDCDYVLGSWNIWNKNNVERKKWDFELTDLPSISKGLKLNSNLEIKPDKLNNYINIIPKNIKMDITNKDIKHEYSVSTHWIFMSLRIILICSFTFLSLFYLYKYIYVRLNKHKEKSMANIFESSEQNFEEKEDIEIKQPIVSPGGTMQALVNMLSRLFTIAEEEIEDDDLEENYDIDLNYPDIIDINDFESKKKNYIESRSCRYIDYSDSGSINSPFSQSFSILPNKMQNGLISKYTGKSPTKRKNNNEITLDKSKKVFSP